MGYLPATKSGHNMFEMASLLQKAARRGDFNLVSYAANEMYCSYRGTLWNRMLTISCEDCWGILTKEVLALRNNDYACNENGVKNLSFVSQASALLARAKKSRDACYFACNFVLSPNDRKNLVPTTQETEAIANAISALVEAPVEDEQLELFTKHRRKLRVCGDEQIAALALLYASISVCDMENIGYAIDQLRGESRNILWAALVAISVLNGAPQLTAEVIALQETDNIVNGKKKPEKRDEIFISKAVMLLCYERIGWFSDFRACSIIDPYSLIGWENYRIRSVEKAKLPDDKIPEYVYDVHTIRGKRNGKTDWIMNIDEQAALAPLQTAFFDDGSWGPRYDWKYPHGMCSEQEYLDSLEYRKTRKANPVERIEKRGCNPVDLDEIANENIKQIVKKIRSPY